MKTFIKNNLSKVLLTAVFVVVFSFVLGPALYASFIGVYDSNFYTHRAGWGYGYGFGDSGYGFGYGYRYIDDYNTYFGYGFNEGDGPATVVSTSATSSTATIDYSTTYLAKTMVDFSSGDSTTLETEFTSGSRSATFSSLTCGTTYSFTITSYDVSTTGNLNVTQYAGPGVWTTTGTVTTQSCGGGIIVFGGSGGVGNGGTTPSVGGAGSGGTGGSSSGTQNTVGCQPGYLFSPISGVRCTDNTPNKQPFLIDLEFRTVHPDVARLQNFLNRNGAVVALPGNPGSLNNETTYMGPATVRALAQYQRTHGISPARGYFGPITRAFINALLGFK